jgi:glycosyltransferase involved in cell wall biosynthesis
VSAVLQLAVPRGFGWGLAECQWKGKPAVVGRHGQLPEQIGEGESGFVTEGARAAAAAVTRLLREPVLASTLGRRGRERVTRDYLITGLLGDYLRLFRQIVADRPAARRA